MNGDVEEPVLPLGQAVQIVAHARWDAAVGWTLSVTSLTEYEAAGVPQEARQHPSCLYDRLALAELIDTLEAEVVRRRGWR